MADDTLLTTSEFEQLLEEFLTKYKNNYFSKTALNSLQKTFHTHNITIQDWNTMVEYLNANVEGIENVSRILEHIAKYAIRDSNLRDYLINNYFTKEEVINYVTLSNLGQSPIISATTPQGTIVHQQEWFDTSDNSDNTPGPLLFGNSNKASTVFFEDGSVFSAPANGNNFNNNKNNDTLYFGKSENDLTFGKEDN